MESNISNKSGTKRISGTVLMAIYFVVSIVGIIIVAGSYNGLINAHDYEITADVNNLIAEKMNQSIDYMQKSVDEMATVLSYQDLLELDQLYDQLRGSLDEAEYISIGIVAEDGTVYGLESEKVEMEKWDWIKMAAATETVSISEPYRSAQNGQLVFTMFSPIFQQGERLGCIFVTYPLAEIQNLANSKVLNEQVEIYLMNQKSLNIILCSGSDKSKIGKWNSTLLMKQDISPETLEAYEAWESNILNNSGITSVQFELDGVNYTQVYEPINAMEGWGVVARIPNEALSNTMQDFRFVTIVYVIGLVIASIILFTILKQRDNEEKAKFEYLSTHDPLTKIFNRSAFDSRVQNYLHDKTDDNKSALVFIDIDYFKQINDSFGHGVGDKALITFANLLNELFGDKAIIARYGGDEFVLFIKEFASKGNVNAKLDELKIRLGNVTLFKDLNSDFDFHYSAGIAAYPENAQDFSELIKYADQALYKVKEDGRNGYRWYK